MSWSGTEGAARSEKLITGGRALDVSVCGLVSRAGGLGPAGGRSIVDCMGGIS